MASAAVKMGARKANTMTERLDLNRVGVTLTTSAAFALARKLYREPIQILSNNSP